MTLQHKIKFQINNSMKYKTIKEYANKCKF